ncbi:GNAT family N-acetyltransferase [Desulfovibrio sulfodismutans]|uniref:GNAT family N-acetyltransferase n=1 Tax=Desulfolutivibrio sulfodismutans TaxID=63561 RepID=A0A7K3NMQ9_9BACT|nr:GNAT family N-acetyltransferase [Desulfolutivibrio sulfodismutans]NDY56489.1 GNAT family N-acetyltransferase [Desulfolutivibrio sulfodismutans]QLA12775.1 GNAT family N-acetyltransferase [Desulfolutivibrio sulfodismutans DSM 3696]
MPLSLRQADPEDASAIARIIREVSAGVADFLLHRVSLAVSVNRLLATLVMEPGNPFSYENALLLEHDGRLAGLLLAYPWNRHGYPDILQRLVAHKRLEMLDGMLRTADAQSLYINTLWVDEALRGTGTAGDLLECATLMAKDNGLPRISLHVWNDNARAMRFYLRHGFTVARHYDVPRYRQLQHDGGFSHMTLVLAPETTSQHPAGRP